MKQGARNLKDGSTKKLLLVLLLTTVLRGQNSGTTVSITDTDEVRAGQILAEEFAQKEGMRSTPQTTKIDEYLQAVGDRVAAHAQRKLPYRFHFDPSPAFKSAVGLPGGQIFVGGGILAYMDSEDQLAAVLGHEVEHIALNQCRDRLIQVLAEKHLSTDKLEELKLTIFYPDMGTTTNWQRTAKA